MMSNNSGKNDWKTQRIFNIIKCGLIIIIDQINSACNEAFG